MTWIPDLLSLIQVFSTRDKANYIMKGEQKKRRCIYCGEIKKITRDHVPPKGFFPEPKPTDLITVPSCSDCNKDTEKDEDYFRATFMFSDAGTSTAGRKLWNQKIDKMYKKNLGLRGKIAQDIKEVNLVTPSGLYIRRGSASFPDSVRLENVVCKITKGLFYHEYKERIPSSVDIMAHLIQTQEERNEAFKYDLQFGSRDWPGVFEYRFDRTSIINEGFIFLMRFYECIIFWVLGYNEKNSKIQ